MAREDRGSVPTGQVARHGRLRRSVSWANAAKVLLTAALVFALSGVSVGAYAIWGLVAKADIVDLGGAGSASTSDELDAVGAANQTIDGELTILLVGTDSRKDSILDDGEEGELNDVNLLLHVPADHKSATIISFPRDLMVPIPSCTDTETGLQYSAMSEQQINSALGYGGVPCVAATISELTGIDIPYAAMVNFDGVIDISNAIGGVDVCLAQDIDDDMIGLHLPAGMVTLKGVEALQFLRTRYGVGDGSDVSRISNQQVFMSALMRQLRSAETLSDPVKVYSLAKSGFENLTLSSSMASIPFMQALAGTAVNIDLERIAFVQYPSFSHPYSEGRLTPDRFSGEQLIDVVLSGEPFEVAGVGTAAVGPDGEPIGGETVDGEEVVDGEVDGEGAVDGEVGPDSATVDPSAPGVIVLPDNIQGQFASDETCSAGRTQY